MKKGGYERSSNRRINCIIAGRDSTTGTYLTVKKIYLIQFFVAIIFCCLFFFFLVSVFLLKLCDNFNLGYKLQKFWNTKG